MDGKGPGMVINDYIEAAKLIRDSNYTVAFTGAGISVESGIPPFRGPTGLWNRYDPEILDIGYFTRHPESAWKRIKEIFFDFMQNTRPNEAHRFLAWLEAKGKLEGTITQNIDSLHQKAGSNNVVEFHGTASCLECMACKSRYKAEHVSLETLPPVCMKCWGVLKPDFVFFGEPIPHAAYQRSIDLCERAEVMLIIGTTGEIMPASRLPFIAPPGCKFIEINIEPSNYTDRLSDVLLQDKATVASRKLLEALGSL